MNTLDVLIKTREILGKKSRWTQGTYTSADLDGCYCLVGGVAAAVIVLDESEGADPWVSYSAVSDAEERYIEVFDAITDAILEADPAFAKKATDELEGFGSSGLMVEWNDKKGRLKREVLAVLDDAIAKQR